MKCKDTGKLIIDKLAGELSPRQAVKLDKHLTSCDACRKEFEALSKAWQFSNETLKEDNFAKKLTPAKRSEIFSIAQNEEKRQRSSRRLTRLVECLAILMICVILAGMMLPALNQARPRARRIAAQSRIKRAKLAEMQKEMDDEAGSDDETAKDEIGNGGFRKTDKNMSAPAAPWTMDIESAAEISGVSDTLGGSSKEQAKPRLITKSMMGKLFKKLQQEEKELKDLRKGLPFIKCISRPVSTFSIDTDTASYVQTRKSIMRGERPDPLKIRPEEFINYFDYNYRSPDNSTFAVYPEAAPSPFRPNNTLFRIGIQGKRLGPNANTRTHYTILLDTSGSMAVKDRMELAKKALAMLVKKLKPSDYVSLLLCSSKTYSVFSIKRLTSRNRQKLLNTLNNVTPRGVADFANGISKAYSFADRHYPNRITSRIIIISDGIFELNAAGRQNITTRIEAARKRGISNIVIGLGDDGDDNMLEKVAAIGDGSYVFLDTEREAEELFTTQFEARFREIARDVKIQVEFNPDAVKSYRQIGYKNRRLSKADFRNDKVDAGEVGSGQAVTALYELNLKDNIPKDTIVATIRIRYKKAGDMSVEEKAFSLYENDIKEKFKASSSNFKLAAFVAEFAESLRYPETQGIASTRGVADKLNGTWMKHYRKDRKVTELLSLIKRSK